MVGVVACRAGRRGELHLLAPHRYRHVRAVAGDEQCC